MQLYKQMTENVQKILHSNSGYQLKRLNDKSSNSARLKSGFTRCQYILKTLKSVMNSPTVHTKTGHFCLQILETVDFENGTLTGTF